MYAESRSEADIPKGSSQTFTKRQISLIPSLIFELWYNYLMSSTSAAFVGFLFALPFILTNFVISLRINPFYSFLDTFPAVRNSSMFPLLLVLLFPMGAFIALQPMLKTSNGKRKFYFINSAVASIMLVVFILLFSALVGDAYRCDVLKIPNCD